MAGLTYGGGELGQDGFFLNPPCTSTDACTKLASPLSKKAIVKLISCYIFFTNKKTNKM